MLVIVIGYKPIRHTLLIVILKLHPDSCVTVTFSSYCLQLGRVQGIFRSQIHTPKSSSSPIKVCGLFSELPQQPSKIFRQANSKTKASSLVMSVVAPEISSVASNHGDVSSVSTVHETETPPGNSAGNSSVVETDQSTSKVVKPEARKVCYQFRRGGNCRFGIDCKYEHDESSVRNFIKSSQLEGQRSKVCYSFAKSGKCRFEGNCRFSHKVAEKSDLEEPQEQPPVSEESNEPEDLNKESHQQDKGSRKETKRQQKVCKFFQQGSCRKGKSCRFLHRKDEQGELAEGEPHPQEDEEAGARKPVQRSVIQIQTYLRLSELTDDDLQKLRNQEVQQLKKRFPDLLEMENEGQPSIYRILVHPTDPDWPYDVRDFQLNVSFPKSYPAEPLEISLPEDQEIPDVVLRHITAATQEWILAKHEMNKMAGKVELTFRPFLRWFDKNLESQFTEGARKLKKEVEAVKAGFEFVTFEKDPSKKEEPTQPSLPEDAIIISKPRGQQSDEEEFVMEEKLPTSMSEMQVNSEEDEEDEDEDDEEEEEEANSSSDDDKNTSKSAKIVYDPPDKDMRGTEIIFQGLKINKMAASLAVTNLTVIIQCARCKNHVDVTTPPRRNNLITCLKCSNRQIMTYRPCLVHAFSHVIGFLDLDGCLPFDVNLVTSFLLVNCLNCSYDNRLKGLHYGQITNMWCEKCHQKITVEAESCRFQRLQPSENIGTGPLHTVKVKGPKKQQKDPAIVDMLPLPENGSCKHYKKSFRWLRFPCCGKFYPCDECHDLDNDDDHEMKFATRMLCGFCAKEQPYSADKPCVRCGSATTKGRTQHWEGGTGCRNKVKMSRNDKQKYSGVSKTVSKKAQHNEAQKKGK